MKASPAPVEFERVRLHRRDPLETLRGREQRAARPEGDDDRLEPPGEEALRSRLDLLLRLDRHAGENGELRLVRGEEACEADFFHIEVADRGRGIERGPDAMFFAEGEGGIDRLERDFELHEDEVAGLKILARRLDVGRRQVAVRALDDEDEIVARGVDEDRRGSSRLPGHALNVLRPDA